MSKVQFGDKKKVNMRYFTSSGLSILGVGNYG